MSGFQAIIDSIDSRADLITMAGVAESAERYEDMCTVMKKMVQLNSNLSVEERNLLSVAYKNVVGARRASHRSVSAGASGGSAAEGIYKTQIEAELTNVCHDILDLLNNTLIDSTSDDEAKVFFLKMAADYYRYLAECIPTKKEYEKAAISKYSDAYAIADKLPTTHPIRLGLALNYSVCLYEIGRQHKEACELAKKAFDKAIAQLDKLEESDYKDSTLIMQLLRDNLTLWTSDDNEDNDVDDEEEN